MLSHFEKRKRVSHICRQLGLSHMFQKMIEIQVYICVLKKEQKMMEEQMELCLHLNKFEQESKILGNQIIDIISAMKSNRPVVKRHEYRRLNCKQLICKNKN